MAVCALVWRADPGWGILNVRVSLPMYNLPEMEAANEAFWAALQVELARLGVYGPDALDFTGKPVPVAIPPDTLLTQVCGWPLQTIYAGQATILGVPVYNAPYCEGPYHAGIFIVRDDAPYATLADLRGCRFVFNSINSNSGMNLPRRALAGIGATAPFFASCIETHSHPANIERVTDGEADATCVDCVTYAFIRRYRPAVALKLRVLAATQSTPALPFVTASSTGPGLRAALTAALIAVARAPEWAAIRGGLLLRDIVPASTVDYTTQLSLTTEAEQLGYPTLL
jgi:ABC-type phosphate/phosphonate transport system substrate-binding protein